MTGLFKIVYIEEKTAARDINVIIINVIIRRATELPTFLYLHNYQTLHSDKIYSYYFQCLFFNWYCMMKVCSKVIWRLEYSGNWLRLLKEELPIDDEYRESWIEIFISMYPICYRLSVSRFQVFLKCFWTKWYSSCTGHQSYF